MIAATSSTSWLTTLADLSIILFMITAADLSNAQTAREQAVNAVTAVATADPVAIYRPAPGAMPFDVWLAAQPADSRQRVTILVRHTGTDQQSLITAGMKLAAPAKEAGRSPRLIVEQAERAEIVAMLTYDAKPEPVAHKLLFKAEQQGLEDSR